MMKISTVAAVTALWLVGGVASAQPPTQPTQAPSAVSALTEETIPRISFEDFKKGLESGSILVIDVREAESYANGHISGAISIPLDFLEAKLAELKKEKKPIVTYCA